MSTGYTITVKANLASPSTGDAGHVWVTVAGPNGVYSYGFYPKTPNMPFDEGQIRTDDDAHYPTPDFSKTFDVGQDAYQHAMDFAQYVQTSPGPYNVDGRNCVNFATHALIEAGLLPRYAAAFGAISPDGFVARMVVVDYFKQLYNNAYGAIADWWNSAQTWVMRRDPLTFDLDGDGIETLPLSTTNPIFFDHDGDGNKTATGWIKPDDGFLALDRNGDGIINNGTELFGDATTLYTGGKAADGFAALAQEDTNLDGKVDASDARFSALRIWRDLNSDGISQTGELFTLASLNIASINVTKTSNNTLLPNGNVIADLGTYTKTDGTTATLGDAAQLGDVNLAQNTFISQFVTPIPITPAAAALPNMGGSGQVRELQEAASLSPNLLTALTNYSAATTRETQQAQLDSLIQAWSDTSTMATTATGAYAGHALTVTFAGITSGTPEYQAWLDKLTILEHFNGRTFRLVPTGTDPVTIAFSSPQMDLLNQSYAALNARVAANDEEWRVAV